MKTTTIVLSVAFLLSSIASAEGLLEWTYVDGVKEGRKDGSATLSGKKDVSLQDLRQEMKLALEDVGLGFNDLTVRDSSILMDDTALFVSTEENGGPGLVSFMGNVTLNFTRPILIEDEGASFVVGGSLHGTTDPSAHLTINIASSFLTGLDWRAVGNDSDIYLHRFMSCLFFQRLDGVFDVTIAGQGKGAQVGGFNFVGYVADETQLKEGDLAVMALVNMTDGSSWAAEGWPGYSLALVGKSSTMPSENLPEPTTGTLSLLALAGLAARRRRK